MRIGGSGALDGAIKTGVGNIMINGIADFTLEGFISLKASFVLGAADGGLIMETGTGKSDVSLY